MHFPFEPCSSAQRAHWSVEVTLGSSSALVGSSNRCEYSIPFDYRLHHDHGQQFYSWQRMMQDFSPQGQDGVRCLVDLAFLLLRSFVLRFAVHYRRLAFSRACRTARTSGKRTREAERGVRRS